MDPPPLPLPQPAHTAVHIAQLSARLQVLCDAQEPQVRYKTQSPRWEARAPQPGRRTSRARRAHRSGTLPERCQRVSGERPAAAGSLGARGDCPGAPYGGPQCETSASAAARCACVTGASPSPFCPGRWPSNRLWDSCGTCPVVLDGGWAAGCRTAAAAAAAAHGHSSPPLPLAPTAHTATAPCTPGVADARAHECAAA